MRLLVGPLSPAAKSPQGQEGCATPFAAPQFQSSGSKVWLINRCSASDGAQAVDREGRNESKIGRQAAASGPEAVFSDAAGKASAAIDAALEAVRKHWIEKELKQGKPDASAVLRAAATASAAASSTVGAAAAPAAAATPPAVTPAVPAVAAGGVAAVVVDTAPAGGTDATRAGGVARTDAAGNTYRGPAAAACGQTGDAEQRPLAAKLSNRNVSRIFTMRGKPLDRITEAHAGSSSDEEA